MAYAGDINLPPAYHKDPDEGTASSEPVPWHFIDQEQVSIDNTIDMYCGITPLPRHNSVCLFVRLSQVGVLPIRLNMDRVNNAARYSRNLFFLMPKILLKFQWGHPNGGAKYRWGRLESAIFDQYFAIPQKHCKICSTKLQWKADRNSHALYRSVLFYFI